LAPEGFKPLFRTSPYIELIGPLYSRGEGAELTLGLRAERKHCNMRGTVHGGVLATLADITANLSLDFAGAAREGDWLEARVDIQKQGSRLAFGNCYITRGDERIVRASAVFLVAGTLAEG
jgi:acyl-coenzyme A thioesterase PaaI-like protein